MPFQVGIPRNCCLGTSQFLKWGFSLSAESVCQQMEKLEKSLAAQFQYCHSAVPALRCLTREPKCLLIPQTPLSVCCCLFILFLFLSELTGFIATEIVNELYVDDPDKDSGGKIEVNLNISLPNLHCELVGLDIQDEMGRHEVGHIDNSMKIPLNNGDGCRFEGHFSINKVPGNFHVSTHSATAQPQNPDMTHVIHKLSFGDKLQVHNVHGAFNALEGADKLSSNPLASHDYILKIVPTVYEDMSGKQRYSYQYTVANKEYVAYSHTGRIIPAIWFRYDLSPITVKYTERRQPLYRFITSDTEVFWVFYTEFYSVLLLGLIRSASSRHFLLGRSGEELHYQIPEVFS
uniref:Endoplasmic reticulum-Golgi intermediate compartment protein n=1 Tax=Taeniopygia guttata TaxID=59729 RepID=H0YPW2_TAEGU